MTHGAATTPAQLKNVQAIADFELSARQHRSRMDSLTDGISRAASHPVFVLAHLALFLVWIIVNAAGRPFDPFPFNLLSLVVSLEAIVLSGFLLIAQNRMTRQAVLDLATLVDATLDKNQPSPPAAET